nr:MAG TPA: hypothetical protein [Caudoviricetes sp.]
MTKSSKDFSIRFGKEIHSLNVFPSSLQLPRGNF